MEYELVMKYGGDQTTYQKETLEACCEHIRKMLLLAVMMGWELTFEIYRTDNHGNKNILNWQLACLVCEKNV